MTVALKLDSCTFYVKIWIWPCLDRFKMGACFMKFIVLQRSLMRCNIISKWQGFINVSESFSYKDSLFINVAVKLDSCTFYVKIRIWSCLDRINMGAYFVNFIVLQRSLIRCNIISKWQEFINVSKSFSYKDSLLILATQGKKGWWYLMTS